MYCNEDRYFKIDTLTHKSVGNAELARVGSELPDEPSLPQEGHPTPLGNYVILADDHGWGSGLVPNSQEPDRKGPQPTMVNPADGAIRQAATTRVGLSWSDQIDFRSVNAQTFIVREAVSKKVLTGRYSGQQTFINFFPDQPLKFNTDYEVYIPKGGINDYAKNPVEKDFLSRFRTRAQAEIVYSMVPRDSITIVATSTDAAQAAKLALDGDAKTFWHSSRDRAQAPMPQSLTLTFSKPQTIRRLVYTPPLIEGSGRVKSYQILVSKDGINFTEAAAGKWAENDSVKTVNFAETPALAVRLVALDGTNGFASAGEIQIQRLIDNSSPLSGLARKRFPGIVPDVESGMNRDLRGRSLPGKTPGYAKPRIKR
jgi:hypothetical protein